MIRRGQPGGLEPGCAENTASLIMDALQRFTRSQPTRVRTIAGLARPHIPKMLVSSIGSCASGRQRPDTPLSIRAEGV